MATPTSSLPGSFSPHELRNNLRRTLKATLDHMDSDACLIELDAMTEEKRNAALITRGQTFRAWRKLNNHVLDEIRDQLVANETDLRKATDGLDQEVEKLATVTKVLDATNKLLSVVAKVTALL